MVRKQKANNHNAAWVQDAPDTSPLYRIAQTHVWAAGLNGWLKYGHPYTIRPGKSVAALRQQIANERRQPVSEIRVLVWIG